MRTAEFNKLGARVMLPSHVRKIQDLPDTEACVREAMSETPTELDSKMDDILHRLRSVGL